MLPILEARPPRVSVIVIVRNGEAHLSDAIQSVLDQSFLDFELLVIDDASTDETPHIIEKYEFLNSRVRSIRLAKNLGRAGVRNCGIDNANGDFIVFLDADDQLPVDSLKHQYEVASRFDSDIVLGKFSILGFPERHHYTSNFLSKERHAVTLSDELSLLDNHHIVGRFFRRNFLSAQDIRFPSERRNGEDVAFSFYTLYFAERISIAPQMHVYVYKQGNYFDTATLSKLEDARDNTIDVFRFACENGPEKISTGMKYKALRFASDLRRAAIVFGDDIDGFLDYILTLKPLVKDIKPEEICTLPKFQQRFALGVLEGDADYVYQHWVQQSKLLRDGTQTGEDSFRHHLARRFWDKTKEIKNRFPSPVRKRIDEAYFRFRGFGSKD